ncbi:hypothetical protein PybrP1_002568 [[Pythium] brassicae (nom. inval.)]|nr:hypothetical protein PybrP1_002568 [[Pythium] brassicae (nom. inval.)]
MADVPRPQVDRLRAAGVEAKLARAGTTHGDPHHTFVTIDGFDPAFGARSKANREPFKRWLIQMLRDFVLSVGNLVGAMSDSDSDVKWMMAKELNLQWEWRVAHMLNLEGKSHSNQLINFQAHRFLGLLRVVERIIENGSH